MVIEHPSGKREMPANTCGEIMPTTGKKRSRSRMTGKERVGSALSMSVNRRVSSQFGGARAGAPVELQDGTGVLRYWPSLFSPSTQERLFHELTQDPNLAPPPTMEANDNNIAGRWTQRPITLFGKEIMQPRLTCFYGREGVTYKYSGKTLNASPWEGVSPIQEILSATEAAAGVGKGFFNCVLLNWYRTGTDYMGWHSDDEKELEEGATIASVSLGEERRFQMRRKSDHGQQVELLLVGGSLFLMEGSTQLHWQHRVPKRSAKEQRQETEARVRGVSKTTEGIRTIPIGDNQGKEEKAVEGRTADGVGGKEAHEKGASRAVFSTFPATGRINLTFRRVLDLSLKRSRRS